MALAQKLLAHKCTEDCAGKEDAHRQLKAEAAEYLEFRKAVKEEGYMAEPRLDELCINTMRFLAVDTVQQANSGHPGTPMGAAPMGASVQFPARRLVGRSLGLEWLPPRGRRDRGQVIGNNAEDLHWQTVH